MKILITENQLDKVMLSWFLKIIKNQKKSGISPESKFFIKDDHIVAELYYNTFWISYRLLSEFRAIFNLDSAESNKLMKKWLKIIYDHELKDYDEDEIIISNMATNNEWWNNIYPTLK